MKTLLLSLALILVVPISHADLAPTTVAGLRLIGVISSGSGVAFASYGGFAITLASTTYTVTPLSSNVINQTGTYTYTKTGPNSATLHQVDGATGVAGTTNVTFNSATEANYSSSTDE